MRIYPKSYSPNKHTAGDRTPYTYLIGWPHLNVWYYGVRYAKNCHPGDLWNPYKTSSNYVKKFVLENGEPTIFYVRRTFCSVDSAREWEEKVLKRMHVVNRDDFLNKTDGKAFPIDRAKTSNALRGKYTKAKGASNAGWVDTRKGKEMSSKNNGMSTCPHCNKVGQYRALKRWHFDSCPESPIKNTKQRDMHALHNCKQGKKIEIDGEVYNNVPTASRLLGITVDVIRARLVKDKFPNYKYHMPSVPDPDNARFHVP